MPIARIQGLPAQAATNSDKKAARSLYKLVEKLLRKHPELQELARELLAESSLEDPWLSTFSFLLHPDSITEAKPDQINPEGKQAVFSLDASFTQQLFSSTTELCCFLLSEDRLAFVTAVKILGRRTAQKLEAKCHALETILNRLEKRAESGQKDLKGNVTLDFWQAEYSKRCFLLDQKENDDFQRMARNVFEFLREQYRKLVRVRPDHCADCAWANGSTGARPGFSWLGCNGRKCDFTKQVAGLLTMERRNGMEFPSAGRVPVSKHNGWHDCLSLHEYYCMPAYEFFSFTEIKTVFAYWIDNEQFPKRLVVLPPYPADLTKDYQIPFKPIETAFNRRKKSLCGFRYHEMDEDRLIGLWLWDKAYQAGRLDNPPSELFEDILAEPWFRCTGIGKRVYGDCKNANMDHDDFGKAELHTEAFERSLESLRHELKYTKECVRRRKILPKYPQ